MPTKKIVSIDRARKKRLQEDLVLLEEEIMRRPRLGLEAVNQVLAARKILIEGLRYHEHDGHDMPKRVARDALEALGVKRDNQP